MHGLGNDFIFVQKGDLKNDLDIKDIVLRYSNRHTGIGCDQFILYEPNEDFVSMEIYNSDSSKAGACGNATRCLAYMLTVDSDEKKITLDVNGRKLLCEAKSKDEVYVNMGKVSFSESWMPDSTLLSSALSPYLSSNAEFMCADIRNPHLIILDQNLSPEDMNLLGPRMEKSPIFPDGVNVNFAKLINDEIELKVWERGVGYSYACGSGACATFASLIKLGFVQNQCKVRFELGLLSMKLENNEIIMSGPVSFVAEGILNE